MAVHLIKEEDVDNILYNKTMVTYDRITKPKNHILYNSGVGSLSSWYEGSTESEGTKRIKYDTNEHFRGSLGLFPQLDVMPGAATSANQAFVYNWGLTPSAKYPVDVATLNYEEALSALHGYRIHNNMEITNDEQVSNSKFHEGLFQFSGDNIDQHTSQAPNGRHPFDTNIAKLSEQVATQHNMGDALEARNAGLERGENPALNVTAKDDEQVYKNKDNFEKDVPTAVPMDVDAIQVNGDGEITKPEDTVHVLGGNQTF